MSIVQCCGEYADDHSECDICGKAMEPPYMVWLGRKQELAFCSKCCADNGRGMIADIVQLAAIHQTKQMMPGFTLERVRIMDVRKALDETGLEQLWKQHNARKLAAT